ncbi:extracellular matrix organizing protein FRAS1 [Salmo trutta]|uniref:extracellular matrix organizing protein FRAS1 n=1 Tax=Salmo trutta TaxID=8032 RepID=UPI001130B062|nr:extracellular matrix protein FRAS1-like [Salmo trutta]
MSCMHAVNMGLGWIFIAALAGILTATPGIQGACVYQGSLFANNTLWRPDSCQECQCFSDITVCQLDTCLNPHCDYQRGDRLRIPPNQCCPECLPSSQGACQHDEAVYGHDSQWSVSQCQVCVCSGGSVSCSQRPCPPLSCPPDQIAFTPAGDCCPKCARRGASCSWEDHEYRDGEEWRPSPCSKCVCMNRLPQCFTAECQPVVCKQHESLVIQPGQCCPQCFSTSCLSAGKEYKHGEQWQKSGCTRCVCDRGQSRCHTHTCPPRTCEKGQTKVKRAGRCCDECVAAKGSCLYELTVRYHGDMWNTTDCEFCTCESGRVLCQRAQCARVECPTGSELVHLPGKCCPECQSLKTSCVYSDSDQSSGKPQRPLVNQERWSEGPCRECECREGRVTCYLMTCPICPLGTLAVPHQGTCCPECKQVQCQRDCLSCSGTPDHCESCKDSDSLLLDGHCVSTCPRGYYADGKVCAACQSSCATCENDFECSSCGGSLLLNNRHCVATCDPGSYQDTTQCLRCHASCSVCVGPSQQECVLCSDPSHLLRDGLCVPDCGSGFYIQQGTCYACDSSCITCYPDNPNCMSCSPGSAMHHGKCISHCPDQHYLDSHGHCRACHSFCWSCSGAAVSQCTVCTQGLSLHQGQCLEACGQGLYHQDGTCLNCHPSCRTCVGPLSSDCLRCLKPEEALQPLTSPPHTPLPHGVCVAECPATFYLDAQHTCRVFSLSWSISECHTSCLQCTGGSSQNCTSCGPPYVLQEGQCVPRCHPGHTVQDNTCQGCHPSCQECSGTSQADCVSCPPLANFNNGYCRTSCPDGLFLHPQGFCQECSSNCQRCVADLQTGVGSVCLWCKIARTLLLGDHCVTHCPQGHYPWHGASNSQAPTLRIRGSLLVPIGGTKPLVTSLISAQDQDSPPESLVFQLLQPPTTGCVVVLEEGRETELARDDTFSWAQLQSGQVRFTHDKDKARSGQFSLRVADPQLYSRPEMIQVQAVSMQAPQILTLNPLLVDGGKTSVISKTVLQIDDPDNPQDVLVMVLDPPQHGRLTRLHGDRVLNQFKMEELSREQVQYLHDGSLGKQDRMLLQVNDGHSYQNILLQINITQKLTNAPHVVSVPVTWVREGGMVQLGKRYLRTDYQGDDQIVYTIVRSKESPKYGEVVLVPMPADGPVEGWQPSPDDRSSTPTSSFTQQDVNEGTVWYKHFGTAGASGPQGDTFQFQVSSESSPDTLSDAQTFTIGVMPELPGFPQLAPACDLQITALEDRVTVLTPTALSFVDFETPSEKLVYNITKPLPQEQGSVEHRDRPYNSVSFFTQADVNQGQILYRPPQAPSHLQELYQYSFTVSDGEHTTPEMDFSIRLLASHQQPPVFQIIDPVLEVRMGGRTSLGGQHLAVTDADTASGDLEFEMVEGPVHGTLVKMELDSKTEMMNGDMFSFSDVTHNVLQYEHSGLSADEDAITFTVTDGSSMATAVVQVVVLGVGGDGPRRDPEALLSMEVPENSSSVIRRTHLGYMSDTSPDDKIRIQLVSVPTYGILTRTGSDSDHEVTQYSSFTVDDINKHRIRYITSFETRNQPVTDIFHFIVYDGENNRLDNQMCTITITSKRTQPPAVTVRSGIKVQGGGRVQLSTNHIIVSDLDTPNKDLLVWMITVPKYGFIENTIGRVGLMGGSNTLIISPEVPFSVDDLTTDHIFYVQNVQNTDHHYQDTFSFYISDGSSQTEPFNVNIDIQQSKEEKVPGVSVNRVRVEENSGVVITNSSLNVLDQDTPDNDIIITVTKQPTYGKLLRRQFYSQPLENGRVLSQGSTFTYQDVLDLLLVYTPDGATGGSDELAFSLTDGVHTSTGRLTFTIDVRKTEGPRMTVNRGLQLAAGLLEYSHEKGDEGGSISFKFNLVDPEGNKLIDQSFYISIIEDHLPPSVVVNKGLVLDENSVKKLTTLQLSATDQDSEPGELVYRITKQTALGHLEHASTPGSRITSFSQADLASRSIQYVHTSEEEKHTDEFSFIVSDGANEVAQTFYITIRPVDDSLPLLVIPGMRVQEGVRKTITEFELKATDADTEEESITFTVVQAPRHGSMERTNNGQHYRQTNSFTMDDVYQNRISYNHDGSNSLKDRFTFTVTDGTNVFFMVEEAGKEVLTAAPQKFKIDILPVDDGTPRIVMNLGLQWLEYTDNKATNLISKKELLTMDPDTDDGQLVYEVTAEPKHGFLESKLKPGAPINTFTQADINLGLIRYVLHEESVTETMDNFKFLVKDSKPNVVSDNLFHIQWSLVSFQHRSYNVSEKAGTVSVTVKRMGNLNQYAIVLCRTEQGTATSTSSVGSHPGQHDYVEYAGQVQFDEREDTKVCTVVIQDDKVFEGVESFQVELSMPVYALLGQVTRASVNINDTEDEPTLQFDKKTYHVNESTGFIHAPIERKGDTSSTVSALCYTVPKSAKGSSLHGLESGSDYKSRGMTVDSRVIFGPGVSMSTCDVKLIDDSEYELSEEFELHLSDASANTRMGDVSVAKVFIDGPNDALTVSLGNATFTFSEDAGTIEIPVLRQGSDLSSVTSVWCATRPSDPPSATPGVDYIPSSRKVEFKAGKTVETCSLTIMDDIQNPAMEGAESFVVFLSSPQGAVLLEPFQASVVITDTLDLPSMQFEKMAYKVTEKEGVLDIPIVRTGDLTVKSSVLCFTRTMSAMVMDDFEERRNADDSRIAFLKGEKVKNCTVHINDDSVFEPEEEFQVHLGTPLGDHRSGAMVGVSDMVTVTITNDEDAPTIKFEQTSYQVREPPGPDGIEVLNIKVVRTGDQDRTSKVRCSTRDGSAQSGVDYNPKSRVLKFTPGMDHILFKVEILSNEDREWHESFSLVLGPDDPVEAVLGEITTATVTILDQEAAGSLILPATPIVVSLSDYDNVAEVSREGSKKQPSPGYPLVCVTPCDPHYPKYSVMRERCNEAGINQTSVHFSWEVAAPTDTNGARSPFETVTDTTPYTGVNHMVLDSIYFSRRFHVRCVAQARDKSGHLGTPLRSNIATIGTECSICHTPVTTGTARGFQAQSFIATLKYLDVKHKKHPNRIHISVQIPHQDGMLPIVSSMPLHNLHFLLSESIYRQQHICSNLVTLKDLQGVSETGFLDDVQYDSISLGPGYDRPYQFNPSVREAKSIQLYKHLNLKSCIWTFDAYYDMTELIDVCGGSVTADFQVRDSAQSFLTVQVPLYVSYIYVTAPRGWASLEHHTEMEFSFFYDTVLWRTGIQTDSVLSARLQIIRIYIREDGRLVIEFKTHAKFRGQFVPEHHTLPGHKSYLMVPDHLGGIEFDMQLIWSAQSFDSPYQLWKATSSYSRKDYSGEYTVFLIPCTVQPTQPWTDPGDKPMSCTAHAPEKFQLPIAFQQTNRPVPVVYSLNTEFQLCNNEKVFMMDPAISDMSMAEMDYKGTFSMGQTLYGRVLWNPEQNLNAAYKLQLEKVYLCTGRDGYVPFFDPTGTLYNEGPQYGCIQPNKHLKHRFLILDRKQPEVCDRFFHDVPFEANFASDITELLIMTAMPGVDGFTMKVDALYKVEAGHQWYLQVIYVIGPESISGPRIQRSLTHQLAHSSDMGRARRDLTNLLSQSISYSRARRDLVDQSGHLTLDESLIYDNEGDQTKNGTNMKILRLEVPAASTFNPQMGGSMGGGVAALTLLVLVLLGSFLLFRKCRRSAGKKPSKMAEEYPLNTKVEVYLEKTLEKNFSSKHCTVRNINLNINRNHDNVNSKVNGGAKVNGAAKVKQVNLEVKLHNDNDGTEV